MYKSLFAIDKCVLARDKSLMAIETKVHWQFTQVYFSKKTEYLLLE